jgi:hypothetical protein
MVFPFIVNWMLLLLPPLCVRVCRSLFAIIVINWTWKTHRKKERVRWKWKFIYENVYQPLFSSSLFCAPFTSLLHTSHSLSLLHIICKIVFFFIATSRIDFHHRKNWKNSRLNAVIYFLGGGGEIDGNRELL